MYRSVFTTLAWIKIVIKNIFNDILIYTIEISMDKNSILSMFDEPK